MKKHSLIYGILIYVGIVAIVVGMYMYLFTNIQKVTESLNTIETNFEKEVMTLETNTEINDKYSEHIMKVKEHYSIIINKFTDCMMCILVITSLSLVVIGLKFRINSNKNRGIYNSIILAGITITLFVIYFSININNILLI